MDCLNLIMHILILFTISIASTFGLTDGVDADHVNDRLSRVEALLETVINKNQELEKRVEHLETELNGQKIRNDELLKRISKLESKQNTHENKEDSDNDTLNGAHDTENVIQNRPEQHWTDKDNSPKQKRNGHRNNKRLLDSPSTTPLPIKNKPVAFTAIMSSDATGLGTGQGIMFDQVITKVGGAYHTSHGNFIAPADGVYVFTLMAMTTAGKAEHLEFVRDGVTVVVMFVGASSSGTYTSSTGIITLSLSKGNEVWIRTPRASWHGTGELHGFTGALFTSFSGWRLA